MPAAAGECQARGLQQETRRAFWEMKRPFQPRVSPLPRRFVPPPPGKENSSPIFSLGTAGGGTDEKHLGTESRCTVLIIRLPGVKGVKRLLGMTPPGALGGPQHPSKLPSRTEEETKKANCSFMFSTHLPPQACCFGAVNNELFLPSFRKSERPSSIPSKGVLFRCRLRTFKTSWRDSPRKRPVSSHATVWALDCTFLSVK